MDDSKPSRFQVNAAKAETKPAQFIIGHLPESPSVGRFNVEPSHPKSAENAELINENLDNAVSQGLAHPKRAVRFQAGDDDANAARHTIDSDGGTYGNSNLKSFQNVQTLEKAPHIDHYRNLMSIEGAMSHSRPTLEQLRKGEMEQLTEEPDELAPFTPPDDDGPSVAPQSAAVKFGWIKGVFVRCVLNILGVMLYLRISWVAGQAGILLGCLIVLLASLVTSLSTLSMCAIATNGQIKGGGCYFMISRSLGPAYGGAIGIIFSFANSVGAAMYVVGFGETVRDILKENKWPIIDGDMNDVRLIGIVTCCILMAVVFIGVSFEAKLQLILLVILGVSLVSYAIGIPLPASDLQQAKGTLLAQNLLPAFRDGHGFFTVFAVFFPAATGIMAGANISGDLAKPASAIPRGTLLAILVTTIIYLLAVICSAATAVKDASGLISDVEFVRNNSIDIYTFEPICVANKTCGYGLLNSAQVLEIRAGWGPLITAGIFAATLSSALASLVSAPKIFQAVCKDEIFPYLSFFAKGHGPGDEPRRAYLLGFVIALGIILIGDLNAIAPIISNFFLSSYALINYACFDASFSRQTGFRPAFQYYNQYLSLLGAVLCVGVMFVISWWTALLTFAIIFMLYSFLRYSDPDVNWGSSTQAHKYKSALNAMQKLQQTAEHVKNYRPQILLLTGNPVARPSLVDFASNITSDSSLLVCGHVYPLPPSDRVVLTQQRMQKSIPNWLSHRNVKGFYVPIVQPSLRSGVFCLLQSTGLGRLRPNIVLLGFKSDWLTCTAKARDDYFGIILLVERLRKGEAYKASDCFDLNFAVGILRLAHGLDMSGMMKEHHVGDLQTLSLPERAKLSQAALSMKRVPDSNQMSNASMSVNNSSANTSEKPSAKPSPAHSQSSFAEKMAAGVEQMELKLLDTKNLIAPNADVELDEDSEMDDCLEDLPLNGHRNHSSSEKSLDDDPRRPSMFTRKNVTAAQKKLLTSINQFQTRVKKATIDVWWMYDDGGLALLVPHLLSTLDDSYLQGAKMRVFSIAASRSQLEQEQRNMAGLLAKFRIEFSDVFVIPDIARKPMTETTAEFERLIYSLREDNCTADEGYAKGVISDEELVNQKDRTNRQLRTRELLLHHSSNATLVVLTYPVPRKETYSSALYMAWLEMLTKDLPPVLLLRGNQQSVLTFYS